MGGMVKRTTEGRVKKLEQQAKALGLEFKYVRDCVAVFKKSSGHTDRVYGLWGAEIFMQGREFAMREPVKAECAGKWKDPDAIPRHHRNGNSDEWEDWDL